MTITAMIMKMSEGLGRTCSIFGLTLLFSLPLGLVIAFLRMSNAKPLRWLAQPLDRIVISLRMSNNKHLRRLAQPLGQIVPLLRKSNFKPVRLFAQVYISILRGTPLMLQLLVVAYGPFYLFGFSVSRNKLIPIIIAFSLNYAAYFAEIYRGGIESMSIGQYEAASVLGYNKFQTFMRIILPQVIKRILPSVTNEVITLVKDTSLAFTLSYQEMFSIGKQIASSKTTFMPFVIAGVFYYIFNMIVAFVMSFFEKRMDYYR